MAFSKLSKIILFVITGISLVVVLFFFLAENSDRFDELEDTVAELTAPADLPLATLPTVDSLAADSTASDSTAAALIEDAGSTALAAPEVAETPTVNIREELSLADYLIYIHTDIALVWAYILAILTAVSSLLFPLLKVFSNPKGFIKLGAVVVVAAILIVVSYVLSSGTPIEIVGYTGTANSDPGTLKMVDTVLFVTYTLFGIAIFSILFSVIARAFK
ncbi:MAG: hypothetical protein CSA96_04945 [Bacteroidetes bacterium]|nr:MAG: hypothetical protein CSA96_04945 [Bacteroidota bacterium]